MAPYEAQASAREINPHGTPEYIGDGPEKAQQQPGRSLIVVSSNFMLMMIDTCG